LAEQQQVRNVTPIMNEKRQAIILRQLKDVEQQIDHMIRLVERDDACLEIVRQCQATREALNAVSLTLLETCLQSSVARAVACPDAVCRTQQVARLNELYEALHCGGYTVYPINPKYTEIAGCRCYASLAELPAMPDAVVLALAPHVTEQTTPKVLAAGARLVWLPPGCFTESAVEVCQAAGVPVIHDVCPVGALRALQMLAAGDAPV
jgi:uncharacterized protein